MSWRRPPLWLALGFLALLAVGRFEVLDDYAQLILMFIGINMILTLSLNLVNGFMGEFSVGHAGFMATGAYVASLLTVRVFPAVWWSFPAAVLAGAAGAGFVGFLVAIPSFRTRGDYLAIVTLAFNMIVKSVIENIPAVGGPRGFLGMEKATTLPWVAFWTVATLCVIRNLIHSPIGRGILSVREDEIAADLTGVDTRKVKLLAFTVSAAFTGVAGGLYAHLLQYISPGTFDIVKSTEMLVMVYLGGIGSLTGSLLGAGAYTVVIELLRPLGIWRMAIMPLLLILLMLFRPKGLFGLREFGWLKPREPAPLPPLPKSPVVAVSAPASSLPALELRGLSHRFGGLQVLREVDLLLAAGGIHGIIGPNGAGKTTLFNLVSGVYAPTGGTILLRGQPIAGLRPCVIGRAGLSRTFQNIRLYKELSVLDNVRAAHTQSAATGPLEAALHLGRYGAEERRILEESRALLASSGLEGMAQEKARNLPYGLQRRLEILRALATSPSLLLLDEPAAGMLPKEVDNLMDFIRTLKEDRAMTILLIEHQMRFVMGLCERITVLDFGAVLAEGDPAFIRSHPEVIAAYMGTRATE